MLSIDGIPSDILNKIVSSLPPPWYPLVKILLTSKRFCDAIRIIVFEECRKLDMKPLCGELTGSLILALRHAKHARAFYATDISCTVYHRHGVQEGATRVIASTDSWLITLNRITGTAKTRRRSWNPEKWLSLTAPCLESHNGQQGVMERFVFLSRIWEHKPKTPCGTGDYMTYKDHATETARMVYKLISSTGRSYKAEFSDNIVHLHREEGRCISNFSHIGAL